MGNKPKSISTTRFQYSEVGKGFTKGAKSEDLFLKGPIPLSWIQRVTSLPGKTLHVALAIRWLSDMNPGARVKISKKAMKAFGFSADTCRDALKRLEAIGVIEVQSLPGQMSLITLIKP